MDDLKKEIGKRIKQCRKEKGMTQKELAREVGCHEGTIRQYENGLRSPRLVSQYAIAKALSVPHESLFTLSAPCAAQLGTNLAEVGTDMIDRQQAIDALRNYLIGKNVPCDGTMTCRLIENEVISKLPPVQPDLSEYSDKLWQKAYERGKAEAQAEIVRCKDCRFNTYSKKCLNPDSFFLVPADDFYCGYAERRTDEQTKD